MGKPGEQFSGKIYQATGPEDITEKMSPCMILVMPTSRPKDNPSQRKPSARERLRLRYINHGAIRKKAIEA